MGSKQFTNLSGGNVSEERLLSSSDVPDEVRVYLRTVLDQSGLRGTARREVLAELVAHFEDAVAAGHRADDLIREFGDDRKIGTLIRRTRCEDRWVTRRLTRWLRGSAFSAAELGIDFRQAVRGLRKNASYAIVAVATLALGIGANTAVFSVISGVLLRPLPYADAHQLVLPVLTHPSENVWDGQIGYADYMRWEDRREIFQEIGVWVDWNLNVTGDNHPDRIKAALVSNGYFRIIGPGPVLGRYFASEEHERGSGKVAILSEAFWQRWFGSDPGVLGSTVTLDEEQYEVVGVAPPEARWPRTAEIWLPLTYGAVTPDWVLQRDALAFSSIARLQPGTTIDQATSVVDQIARRAAVDRPDTRSGTGARLIPLRTAIVGESTPKTLLLLMISVGFVLLIACANVANLALERSLSRQREISIRTAVGAGRGRAIRPLAFECMIVALLGGVLGIAVAVWGTDLLTSLAPQAVSRIYQAEVHLSLLLFALILSVVTGLAFTLAPAFLSARLDIRQALSDGSDRTGFGKTGKRMRAVTSAIQLALSVILVLGASLATKSTVGLLRTDPGFSGDGVLSLKLFLPHYPPGSPEDRAIGQKYESITNRIEALPGVLSASAVSGLPLSSDGWFPAFPVHVVGDLPASGGNFFSANWNVVGERYFETMAIQLVRGRGFSGSDLAGGPEVVIVSESLAGRLFPDQDPIGKRLESTAPMLAERVFEVVGVVEDVSYTSVSDTKRNVVYVSQNQTAWRAMAVVVRVDGIPNEFADEIRDAVWALDPSVPIKDVRSMVQLTGETIAAHKFVTALVGVFAALALCLALVGVYGVINVSVRQRYHELGVRKALGADGADIGYLLLKQGTTLAVFGIVLGLPVGLVLVRFLAGLLFEVHPMDPIILLGVPLVLAVGTLLAAALPARKAAIIDPVEALRGE